MIEKKYLISLVIGLLTLTIILTGGQPTQAQATDMIITGVVDGPLAGGVPKAVEFFVLNDIADLADYGFSSANNGGGPTGAPEFTFPTGPASAGTFIYVASESTGFTDFFGFAPDYTDAAASINGDDAIELFQSGVVVDVFGEVSVDGTGQPWEYLDGWAYRLDGTGPDGATFVLTNWTFSGPNALDGETSNDTAATPFPIGTYTAGLGPDPAPVVLGTDPADGATNVSSETNIEVVFSEEVTVGLNVFSLECPAGVPIPTTITDFGPATSITIDPDILLPDGAICEGTVAAAQVVDSAGSPMAEDYTFSFEVLACGAPATLISTIQGSGLTSPLIGEVHTIEAVVVGDFQNNGVPDNGDLNGFHVQEEDADADGDPLTSEGLFIFAPGAPDVSIGDVVRLTGSVGEFITSGGASSQTQLSNLTGVGLCGTAALLPTVADVILPVTAVGDFERFEGMSIQVPQTMAISEYFNFDRFGEIVLTTGRQFQPTAMYAPGSPEAAALAVANSLSRITLDDGRTVQNPDPAIHPNGNVFDLTNLFRGGDEVTLVTGVMDEAFGLYRIQPTQGAAYNATNPRPLQHEDIGIGHVKVATFNVLNYFTTLGSRGARDENEFNRQRAKIFAALKDIDADIVGLMEIENNDDAIQDLVDGLNGLMGAGTYAYVDTGVIGPDEIKVALIYKPAEVELVGGFAVLDTPEFLDPNNTGGAKNRPALAQTFLDLEKGGILTVVVNHFKSKGSGCGAGDDDPEQGSCNLTRTLTAQALVDWLATDPTGSEDEDFMIIGDLNSYDKEDPMTALFNGGYVDLLALPPEDGGEGEMAYTYVFDGQLGYLDYAMANQGLLSEDPEDESADDSVTGTTAWHINADEPDILDYTTRFKQDAQDALYESNAFRSSDHDPVIAALDICDEIPPEIEVKMSPESLWSPNHKYKDVEADVTVEDNFDQNPTVELMDWWSSEADNDKGDGNTVEDILPDENDIFKFQVRAERDGRGNGRTYTFTYKATDACGNSAEASATVTVPHDQRDKNENKPDKPDKDKDNNGNGPPDETPVENPPPGDPKDDGGDDAGDGENENNGLAKGHDKKDE